MSAMLQAVRFPFGGPWTSAMMVQRIRLEQYVILQEAYA
jgi:hypothetical protein